MFNFILKCNQVKGHLYTIPEDYKDELLSTQQNIRNKTYQNNSFCCNIFRFFIKIKNKICKFFRLNKEDKDS